MKSGFAEKSKKTSFVRVRKEEEEGMKQMHSTARARERVLEGGHTAAWTARLPVKMNVSVSGREEIRRSFYGPSEGFRVSTRGQCFAMARSEGMRNINAVSAWSKTLLLTACDWLRHPLARTVPD